MAFRNSKTRNATDHARLFWRSTLEIDTKAQLASLLCYSSRARADLAVRHICILEKYKNKEKHTEQTCSVGTNWTQTRKMFSMRFGIFSLLCHEQKRLRKDFTTRFLNFCDSAFSVFAVIISQYRHNYVVLCPAKRNNNSLIKSC